MVISWAMLLVQCRRELLLLVHGWAGCPPRFRTSRENGKEQMASVGKGKERGTTESGTMEGGGC